MSLSPGLHNLLRVCQPGTHLQGMHGHGEILPPLRPSTQLQGDALTGEEESPERKGGTSSSGEDQTLHHIRSGHRHYITTQAIATTSPETSGLNLTGFVCVLHAHMVNCADPGSFQTTLSENLALNGLPDVKLPPNPLSQAIIKAITGKMSPIQEAHQDTEHREEQQADSSTTEEEEDSDQKSDVEIKHDSPDPRPHTQRNESGRHTSSPSRCNSHALERHQDPQVQQTTRKSRRIKQLRPRTGR